MIESRNANELTSYLHYVSDLQWRVIYNNNLDLKLNERMYVDVIKSFSQLFIYYPFLQM